MKPSGPRPLEGTVTLVAATMAFVAATLAVTAFLHLDGILLHGSKPFQPTHAGIAELLIGLALTCGAAALLRSWPHAWAIAVAAIAFAIVGFTVGLSFTIRGAGAIDISYHLSILPLLVLTMIALLRGRVTFSARRVSPR